LRPFTVFHAEMAATNAELSVSRLLFRPPHSQNVTIHSALPGLVAKGVARMNMICSNALIQETALSTPSTGNKQGVVFIASDSPACIERIAPVCDFLDLEVHLIAADTDLASMLRAHRPMAVITDIEGIEQDGFHIMKEVARFNRDLPILLLTEGDSALMGAADAVQEVWGLRSVTLTSGMPAAGQIVSFLFTAGRSVGCMRLVPV
jgi:CheY-like chemotaxis protein